jgi:hypothetical protein
MISFKAAYLSFIMSICVSVLQSSDNSWMIAEIIFVGLEIFSSVNFCKHLITCVYNQMMMMMIIMMMVIIIIIIIINILHTKLHVFGTRFECQCLSNSQYKHSVNIWRAATSRKYYYSLTLHSQSISLTSYQTITQNWQTCYNYAAIFLQ